MFLSVKAFLLFQEIVEMLRNLLRNKLNLTEIPVLIAC